MEYGPAELETSSWRLDRHSAVYTVSVVENKIRRCPAPPVMVAYVPVAWQGVNGLLGDYFEAFLTVNGRSASWV